MSFSDAEVMILTVIPTLWDKQGDFLGQEKLILSHNKTNFSSRWGDFFLQEKLILGYNEINYGTEQGDFLGQAKLTYGHNKTIFVT